MLERSVGPEASCVQRCPHSVNLRRRSLARWANISDYNEVETDLNTMSCSATLLSDSEGLSFVMAETLACDGSCGQLFEVKLMKSFACGHVFCQPCLPTGNDGEDKCPASKCVQRQRIDRHSCCEYLADVKEQAFPNMEDLHSELSTSFSSLYRSHSERSSRFLTSESTSPFDAHSTSVGTASSAFPATSTYSVHAASESGTSHCSSCGTSCFSFNDGTFTSTIDSSARESATATGLSNGSKAKC
ncbi:hypothetical protein L596_019114 [Steinernema carpocapsae]|uniref:RING-type domain-containing protein n=1 Tax=Steinernema carpocapsae TaxID=34508 RepID=A0A4U5N7Y5_STECR|nr:hypothetical protein L596_019114 [Steinernema carpocapsae]